MPNIRTPILVQWGEHFLFILLKKKTQTYIKEVILNNGSVYTTLFSFCGYVCMYHYFSRLIRDSWIFTC